MNYGVAQSCSLIFALNKYKYDFLIKHIIEHLVKVDLRVIQINTTEHGFLHIKIILVIILVKSCLCFSYS